MSETLHPHPQHGDPADDRFWGWGLSREVNVPDAMTSGAVENDLPPYDTHERVELEGFPLPFSRAGRGFIGRFADALRDLAGRAEYADDRLHAEIEARPDSALTTVFEITQGPEL